jgi:hypothetical protein
MCKGSGFGIGGVPATYRRRVPELTRNGDMNLNEQVLLRRKANAVGRCVFVSLFSATVILSV